jgi:hypothetical protein
MTSSRLPNGRSPVSSSTRMSMKSGGVAMHPRFGHCIPRRPAARLLVDQLPEPVEKAALCVLDAVRFDCLLQPEQREFAHRVRRERDTDPEFLDLGRPVVHPAAQAAPVQVERESESSPTVPPPMIAISIARLLAHPLLSSATAEKRTRTAVAVPAPGSAIPIPDDFGGAIRCRTLDRSISVITRGCSHVLSPIRRMLRQAKAGTMSS